jgi:hypothetical protein
MGGVLGVQACHERSHPRLLDDLARLRSRPHPLAPAATIRESACPFGSPPGPRLTALLAEAHTGLPRPDFRERNSRDNLAQASWCCRCRQWLPLEDFRPRLELGGRRAGADAAMPTRIDSGARKTPPPSPRTTPGAVRSTARNTLRRLGPAWSAGSRSPRGPTRSLAARSAGASASSSSDEC